jgi:DNA replication protein DnaC
MFDHLEETTAAESEQRQTANAVVCEYCFGTGTKLDPVKGALPCPCRTPDRSRKILAAAHIPPRYANCTLDNFKSEQNSSPNIAFQYACRLVLDYPAVDQGLLFMGPAGVGKTHLAVGIIKSLLAKGFACRFSEFGSLLKEIQDSYNPNSKSSEFRVLAPVYEADVLVLDELGATVPTDWVRDEMYQIINKRYNDKKVTIFTTNYLDEPRIVKNDEAESNIRTFSRKQKSEAIRMDTLEERIGTRLRSRLYEMCRDVKIEGEDYRKDSNKRGFESARI